MRNTIKAGDVVQLKSGSPAMAVEGIAETGPSGPTAYVIWMTNGERQAASIACVALKKAD